MGQLDKLYFLFAFIKPWKLHIKKNPILCSYTTFYDFYYVLFRKNSLTIMSLHCQLIFITCFPEHFQCKYLQWNIRLSSQCEYSKQTYLTIWLSEYHSVSVSAVLAVVVSSWCVGNTIVSSPPPPQYSHFVLFISIKAFAVFDVGRQVGGIEILIFHLSDWGSLQSSLLLWGEGRLCSLWSYSWI